MKSNKVIHENEVAYRPRHTCRAAEWVGPHRLSAEGATCSHLILA